MKWPFLLILLLLISCEAPLISFKREILGDKLKLCFIGDTGMKSKVQGQVAELLLQEKCHSIHFVGDIIYPNGLHDKNDPQFVEKFWNYYGKVAQSDHKPKLNLVMGNHDHKGSIEAWKNIGLDHSEIFFPHPFFLLRVNDICMVHTDTDYYRFPSKILTSFQEVNWLHHLQNDLKDCRIKMALGHHPYKNSGAHHGPSKGMMKLILEKTIVGKFDYYIAGHEHILSDEGVEDGTRFLISGAGGDPASGGGILVMEISDSKIDYYFKSLPK